MRRKAQQLEQRVNKVVQKAASVAHQELVLDTPVDTGTARSNWIVSLGSPARGVRKAYSPYPKGSRGGGAGTGENANASAAIEAGAVVIARRRPGQNLFITNNLPYIQRLNDGSSDQTPANFVEKAMQHANDVLKRAKVVS